MTTRQSNCLESVSLKQCVYVIEINSLPAFCSVFHNEYDDVRNAAEIEFYSHEYFVEERLTDCISYKTYIMTYVFNQV